MNRFHCLVAALVVLASFPTFAQIYRCKTATGGTEYAQVPCGKDAQLLQSQRESVDTTNPSADLFGVQRERDQLQMEADYYRKKSAGGMIGKSDAASSTSRATRQIDSVACERADREALIEARHVRKDAAAVRRAQKMADWACGRNLPDDPVAASSSVIPMKATLPPPIITSCDQSGCWDYIGSRYNRAGNTNTFFGPNGACTKTGPTLVCP